MGEEMNEKLISKFWSWEIDEIFRLRFRGGGKDE
jgi:hypothetical protein